MNSVKPAAHWLADNDRRICVHTHLASRPAAGRGTLTPQLTLVTGAPLLGGYC